MPLPHLIRLLFTNLLLLVALPVAAQSNSLDSLSQESQDEISRVCLPVQFREGASAYRNCVQAELDLRSSGSSNEMAALSFDDKYAVQQACARAGGQSSSAYQSCVTDQISQLNSISVPVFDNISEDELYAVQQTCFDAQSSQGAASYRQCLNAEVQSLLTIPAADTSKLSALDKNALQLRCSANASTASEYRQCVAVEFESIAGTEPTFLPIGTAAQVARTTQATVRKNPVNEVVTKLAETNSPAVTPGATPRPLPAPTPAAAAEPESIVVAAATAEPQSTTPSTMAMPRNINPRRATSAASQSETAGSNTTSQNTLQTETALSNTASLNTLQTQTTRSNNASPNTLRDATGDNRTIVATRVSAETTPGGDTRVISRPGLVKAVEERKRAEAQGIELEKPADAQTATDTETPIAGGRNGTIERLGVVWQKFLNSLARLDSTGWLIIAGVLALPALLLGLFSLIRRVKQPVDSPVNNASLTERIEPGMHTRKLRHEREAAELFGEPEESTPQHAEPQHAEPQREEPQQVAQEPANEPRRSAEFDEEVDPIHDAVTRIAMKREQPLPRSQQNNAPAQASADQPPGVQANEFRKNQDNANVTDLAWQSAFGQWLTQQPASARMESCIEFLIYWVAYGDERYEPELKKRLFTAHDLNTHDQIKRWVLKQDVFAFSDVVAWLRTNASQAQQEQTLALIMALLVTEHSVTPVQNTLLRFLSDAFNIGKKELEARFENAFGHALPDMPRPDNQTWWHKQDRESVQRWNSRAMASRPERDQMVARLGLPADYNDAQVINAFRRAARRCHPDRFTDLGERERALAEQRFSKFEEARDTLLGVSV